MTILVKEVKELRDIIKGFRKDGLSVGFVPTMGALHEGHKSLIERAVKENDRVVVSVFVNPTQFGPNEDYDSYPRDIKTDLELCENVGVSVVFNPEVQEMYFSNKSTSISVSGLTGTLCGAKRPGHFDGVCLIVSKLFNIVKADKAYFGLKDAQQVAVIKRMVRDLNIDIEIIACPIIREHDGLAKSSRNTYLSSEERQAALVLIQSLNLAKNMLDEGERDANKIQNIIIDTIRKEPLAKIDYVQVVDFDDLTDVDSTINRTILVPIAVYIGKTRLIDNFVYEI